MRVRNGRGRVEDRGPVDNWLTHDPTAEQRKTSHRRRARQDNLKSKYGLTISDYEMLHQAQAGVCAICGQPERLKGRSGATRRLAVDHDHRTGQVRGLLCHACNVILGMLRDDEQRIADYAEGAISYLRSSSERADMVSARMGLG